LKLEVRRSSAGAGDRRLKLAATWDVELGGVGGGYRWMR
jgi:hypothetical protein